MNTTLSTPETKVWSIIDSLIIHTLEILYNHVYKDILENLPVLKNFLKLL